MKIIPGLLAVPILVFSFPVFAKSPDCTGVERWPANLVESAVVDSGFADRDMLDYNKTKVVRLASEKIGKDLYRQVHRVTFVKKSGESIMAIVVSDASHEDCSMTEGGMCISFQNIWAIPQKKNRNNLVFMVIGGWIGNRFCRRNLTRRSSRQLRRCLAL